MYTDVARGMGVDRSYVRLSRSVAESASVDFVHASPTPIVIPNYRESGSTSPCRVYSQLQRYYEYYPFVLTRLRSTEFG